MPISPDRQGQGFSSKHRDARDAPAQISASLIEGLIEKLIEWWTYSRSRLSAEKIHRHTLHHHQITFDGCAFDQFFSFRDAFDSG